MEVVLCYPCDGTQFQWEGLLPPLSSARFLKRNQSFCLLCANRLLHQFPVLKKWLNFGILFRSKGGGGGVRCGKGKKKLVCRNFLPFEICDCQCD